MKLLRVVSIAVLMLLGLRNMPSALAEPSSEYPVGSFICKRHECPLALAA